MKNVFDSFTNEFYGGTTVPETIIFPIPSKGIGVNCISGRNNRKERNAFGVEVIGEEVDVERSRNDFGY